MPLYPLKCTDCAREFEEYAPITKRESIACPGCGSVKCETRYSELTLRTANREFDLHKRESVQNFHHPDDVAAMRRELGAKAGNCIQDDGTVIFNDRAQEREYRKARDAHAARQDEAGKRASHEHAEKVRRGDVVPKPDGTMSVNGDGPRRSCRRASKAEA